MGRVIPSVDYSTASTCYHPSRSGGCRSPPSCDLLSDSKDRLMTEALEPAQIIRQTLDRIEDILQEASQAARPLEIDPSREQLFRLFADAAQRGLIADDFEPNLTSDSICAALSTRWGLKDTVQDSVNKQQRLTGDQLAQMRALWSVMRMWMEWTYAWGRWAEFHPQTK